MASCMYGTVHWCGTVNGKPAVTVSYYGGAKLWIYSDKWRVALEAAGGGRLHQIMGLTDMKVEKLFIEESILKSAWGEI